MQSYLTSSLFFHLKFLLLHFLHFKEVAAFLAPHSLQIFKCSLCFCAMDFLIGSSIGISRHSIFLVLRLRLISVKYTFCLIHLGSRVLAQNRWNINLILVLEAKPMMPPIMHFINVLTSHQFLENENARAFFLTNCVILSSCWFS